MVEGLSPVTLNEVILPTSDDLHIWFVNIDLIRINHNEKLKEFSFNDKKKFNLIQNEHEKEVMIKRNYLLLKILSYYLKCEISQIKIEKAEYGKPFLKSSKLSFNLSNSFNYFIVGISYENGIGVDIEKIRNTINYKKLITRYFSENEKKAFEIAKTDMQQNTFFYWWTIKEAVIKATGFGMRLPLKSFEIPLYSNENVVRIDFESIHKNYYFFSYNLANGTKSCVCIDKKVKNIQFFKFENE